MIRQCPNESQMQFKFCAHLFGHIRRHSVFLSFNCYLFSIIQFLTSEILVSKVEIALCTCFERLEVRFECHQQTSGHSTNVVRLDYKAVVCSNPL